MTLSPSVFELISVLSVSETADARCLDDGGYLRLGYIGSLLPGGAVGTAECLESPVTWNGTECFRETVQALAPVLRASLDFFQSLSAPDYAVRYGRAVEWTCNPRVVERCCELAKSGDRPSLRLALLMLTACFERSLGDVCWRSVNSGGRQPPPLLRDVLVSPALADVLDATSLRLLRTLFGSPASINLRNVIWHGFGAPDELPDALYVSFLLVLLPALGVHCPALFRPHATYLAGAERWHRPFRSLAHVSAHLQDSPMSSAGAKDGAGDFKCNAARATAPRVRLEFFPEAVRPYAAAAVRLYEECRWGEFAVLLLPQVEHAMRCLFCAANGCPERMLTAEAAEYYTTWDEILSSTVVIARPNGSRDSYPNCLLELLGGSGLEMLRDLLIYTAGPRLRDSLGHMEVDMSSIDAHVASFALFIIAELSHSLPTAAVTAEEGGWQRLAGRSAKELGLQDRTAYVCYDPQFHPLSLVRNDLLAAVALAESCRSVVGLPDGIASCDSTAAQRLVSEHDTLSDVQSIEAFAAQVLSPLKCSKCDEATAPAPRSGHRLREWAKSGGGADWAANELRSRLSRAAQYDCCTAADAVRTHDVGLYSSGFDRLFSHSVCGVPTQQTAACVRRMLANMVAFGAGRAEKAKGSELRSRQRANYEAYRTWAPSLLLLARVCIAALVEQLAGNCCCHPSGVSLACASGVSRFNRRREDSLLQLAQKMESHTNPDSNRWAECFATCAKLARTKLLRRRSDKYC